MRTLRELGGWGLLLVVVATPFMALGLLAVAVDDGAWGFAIAGLLAMLAWPRMWLSARRLRQPPEDEVAEADGRTPVVLLHRFARVAEPVLARSLLVLPGFWRDVRDAWLERSLTKAASQVGPLRSLARRAPPPAYGPVSLADDPEWERALDQHLRCAALAVIVLDGSDANALEIEHAGALLGPARTALVVPPELTAARYEALRARIPALPPFERRARVIRFDPEARAYFMSRLLFRDEELAPAPRAPASSLLLSGIPLVTAFFAALSLPHLLEEHPYSLTLPGEAWIVFGLVAVTLGAVLAVLSRRAFRLVPSTEAVMVMVAASPWLFLELGGVSDSRLATRLEMGAIGAAYAAPLLAATAIVLASASLLRAAPGRQSAFSVLGAAALLPFAPLVLALDRVGAPTGLLIVSLLAAALGLGLSAWGASGEPARAHAPLPIGGAVAASLSACAAFALVIHATQRHWLGAYSHPPSESIVELSTIVQAWPFFAWAGPVAVVLVSSQFARRATRPAIASLVALVPLVLLTALAAGAEAAATSTVPGWMFE